MIGKLTQPSTMVDCHPYTDPAIQDILNCYARIRKLVQAAEFIFSTNPQDPDLTPLFAVQVPSNRPGFLATVGEDTSRTGINTWYYSIMFQNKHTNPLGTPITILGLPVAQLEQKLGVQIFLEVVDVEGMLDNLRVWLYPDAAAALDALEYKCDEDVQEEMISNLETAREIFFRWAERIESDLKDSRPVTTFMEFCFQRYDDSGIPPPVWRR
ncbi:hypothetical protein BGZ60DRAFT_401658 [Tricladium varicosporioides]|nr:hypothetical protein BGZ60DRAFT_401658 [Hymenoscyphus varicosporioides]